MTKRKRERDERDEREQETTDVSDVPEGMRENPPFDPQGGGLGAGGISQTGGKAGGARGAGGVDDRGAGGPMGEALGGPGEYKSTSRGDLDRDVEGPAQRTEGKALSERTAMPGRSQPTDEETPL